MYLEVLELKSAFTFTLGITLLFSLSACQMPTANGELSNVGMLIPDTINDEVWNTKGYKGLLKIRSHYKVDVYYKEGITTEQQVEQALDEFLDSDVNLIFGHGNIYAPLFAKLSQEYPSINFVTFNADAEGENITSLHFDGEAMGFFGGLVAAEMSENQHVAVIAAYPWQPEVKGFEDGAKAKDSDVIVQVGYVHSWSDSETAEEIFRDFSEQGADVFYPAGDGFNLPLIELIKRRGLYAIGYVSDQLNLGKETILTSTVQEVEKLYMDIAEQQNSGTLQTGNLYFDFDSGAIRMGEFSHIVADPIIQEVDQAIEQYIDTGNLSTNP